MIDAAEQRQAYNNFRKARVLFGKFVARTPVLSGAMVASWCASYGSPEYRFVEIRDKRTVLAPLKPASFDLQYDRDKAWHIFITNGAPYGQKIENGSSDKAPMGIVRISVMEVFGVSGAGR